MAPDRPDLPFRMTPVVFQVLLSLAGDDAHAYGIMKEVEDRTGGDVRLAPGSLHYTLGKLLDAGLVEEPPERPTGPEDDGRRIYYRLTDQGRQVVSAEASFMARMVELARERDLIAEG
jgi:DNA-binding PadR family transcriptional regulator